VGPHDVRMRISGVFATVSALVLVAAPSQAQELRVTDPQGDGANKGLDIVAARVDNADDRVVARVRFADDVRGDVIVSVDQRGGTGLRLISEHDPAGKTRNYVIPGAFTDRRAEAVRCPGFRARWLEDRPVVRMAMPSRCLGSGDYGAIRFAVLTERGDDTDYASGVPDEGSAWIPRG
jgi:hypothetical protein